LSILIAAPSEAAVGRWAWENTWPLVLNGYDEKKRDVVLAKLADEQSWYEYAERAQQIAGMIFDSAAIHDQLQCMIPPRVTWQLISIAFSSLRDTRNIKDHSLLKNSAKPVYSSF
jgi:hypothetical protein